MNNKQTSQKIAIINNTEIISDYTIKIACLLTTTWILDIIIQFCK